MEKTKISPTEGKMARNIGIIADYKILKKTGKKRPEIIILLKEKYSIEKSLVYQIIRAVENA